MHLGHQRVERRLPAHPVMTSLTVPGRSFGRVRFIVPPAPPMSLRRGEFQGYPLSLIALGAFIVYQLCCYSHTHAFGLIVLTVVDVIVIVLVRHEWRLLRKHLPVD